MFCFWQTATSNWHTIVLNWPIRLVNPAEIGSMPPPPPPSPRTTNEKRFRLSMQSTWGGLVNIQSIAAVGEAGQKWLSYRGQFHKLSYRGKSLTTTATMNSSLTIKWRHLQSLVSVRFPGGCCNHWTHLRYKINKLSLLQSLQYNY